MKNKDKDNTYLPHEEEDESIGLIENICMLLFLPIVFIFIWIMLWLYKPWKEEEDAKLGRCK